MSRNLFIASGGCGGKLLDATYDVLSEMYNLKGTYDGLFVNSNDTEMRVLKNFNGKNSLIINGGGTGRSRSKAKQDLKDDKGKIINFLANKIEIYNNVYLLMSSDGGFGSGSMEVLAKTIRRLNPEISINILATMPKLSSRRLALQNSIDFYLDVVSLMKNENGSVINSVLFIDNDKMKGNESEFNYEVMWEFISSLELGNSAVDMNDSKLINSANGYKVILPLSDRYKSMNDAIDEAVKNSKFIMPSNYTCTHIGGVFVEGCYDKDEVFNHFDVLDFDKLEYADNNLIVLGGCSMPDDHISVLDDVLKDVSSNKKTIESKFVSSRANSNISTTPKPQKQTQQSTVQKLRSLMTDDFWD